MCFPAALQKSFPGDRKQALLPRLLCSLQPIATANTNIMKCLAALYLFVLGEEGVVADGSQVGRRAPRRQSIARGHDLSLGWIRATCFCLGCSDTTPPRSIYWSIYSPTTDFTETGPDTFPVGSVSDSGSSPRALYRHGWLIRSAPESCPARHWWHTGDQCFQTVLNSPHLRTTAGKETGDKICVMPTGQDTDKSLLQ